MVHNDVQKQTKLHTKRRHMRIKEQGHEKKRARLYRETMTLPFRLMSTAERTSAREELCADHEDSPILCNRIKERKREVNT